MRKVGVFTAYQPKIKLGNDGIGRLMAYIISGMVANEMKLSGGGTLPLIVMADTFNRVVFFSQGYSIGLGDRLVKTSKAL